MTARRGPLFAPITQALDAPAHNGRDTARRVLPLFRPYRTQVAVVVGLIVVTSMIGIVNPLLIQAVFSKALFVRGGPRLDLLYTLVSIMAAVPIVNGAIGILQTYQTNRVGQLVMRDLRDRLYSHLQTLSLAFFTNTKTGEIQSRLANDVGGVQSVVTTTASSILANVVTFVSSIVAMIIISWQLTVVSVITVPVFFWLTKVVGESRRKVARSTQESLAAMSALSEETLSVSGVLLAKVFGNQARDTARYHQENQHLAGLQVRQHCQGGRRRPGGVGCCCAVGVTLVRGWQTGGMGLYRDQVLPRIVDVAMRGSDVEQARGRVAAGLGGEVLEIGFGSGRNIPYYPATITKVWAVDPAAVGRKLAAKRAAASAVPIEYIGLDAQRLAQLWWLWRIQAAPDYATHLLPAQLLGGAGVGLAIPSLLGAGSTSLTPARFGTGSGSLNMGRQIGTVLGVAGLVAILSRVSPADPIAAFRNGLVLVIAFFAAAGFMAVALLTARSVSVPVPEPAAPGVRHVGAEQGVRG